MNPYEPTVRVVTVFFAAITGLGLKELLSPTRFGGDGSTRALCFAVALLLFLRFLFGSANHLWAESHGLLKDHYAKRGASEDTSRCPAAWTFSWHLLWLISYFLFLMLICYAEDVARFLFWIWVFTGTAAIATGLSYKIEEDTALNLTGLWLWTNGLQAMVTFLLWFFPTLFGQTDSYRLGFLFFVFLGVLLCDLAGQLVRLETLTKKLNP